jgi:hypothetical protein
MQKLSKKRKREEKEKERERVLEKIDKCPRN